MNLKTIGVFVFIVFVFNVKCYHSSGFGRCPKYIALRNFNVSKIVGTWYEIERTFHLMELITSCVSLNIWENERKQLQVTVRTISRWSGSIIINRGTAIPNKKIRSIFSYKVDSTLPNLLAKYLPGTGIYQFLETDYENFAVIWTCADLGIFHVENSIITKLQIHLYYCRKCFCNYKIL
ncbi:apolipoprotein D-like isoform X2 [Agrilus planipennis]|uniref:Apolipoprotein D-like isoform X2 n=1 Tax=Agrilus planipennis TaxID=224129 RepID=A0A1W4WXH9_AGRPL|nr:apolipoprotein D-like isoform X2 [Agrilus planipennis]